MQNQPPPQIPVGSFSSTLIGLFQKGLRYSTVIDLGCADGSFFLTHQSLGLFPDAVPAHVDANAIYEDSLEAIRQVVGGHYLIAAITDHSGEVDMTTSIHPYWNSLCPKDHSYWDAMRHLHPGHQATVKVPAYTLDDVARKFDLKPPFLIKLDVQGSEEQALRGGRELLQHTSVVICEAAMSEFGAINQTLADAGFDLFDLTNLNWMPDRSLSWFYPVYLNRKFAMQTKFTDWKRLVDGQVVKAQDDRRAAIRNHNASLLEQLRKARAQRQPTR